MSETDTAGHPLLRVDSTDPAVENLFRALGSDARLRILELLSDQILNISEIAEALGLPLSTATQHVRVLEEAGLLRTEFKPGERGRQKVCQRVYDTLLVELPIRGQTSDEAFIETSMPVGAYVDCQAQPTCGLASDSSIIGLTDDPRSFFEPQRVNAQILWFHTGFVEYRFPNRIPSGAVPDSISFTVEVCSEAPMHHPEWPSDITLWINEIEVGTWTSPGDYGGKRGVRTPLWWDTRNTQYGLLKEWRVSREGSFIDGHLLSDVAIEDLRIAESDLIEMRLGVKPDARNSGGLNLFGQAFGNYPQDIVMRLRYL